MKVVIRSDELDVLRGFLEEAWEHLEGIEDKILELEEDQGLDTVNSIFRPVHTIKGTAAFLGLNDIKELCHETETVLDQVRKDKLNITPELIDILLDAIDTISQMLRATEEALDAISEDGGEEVELDIEDVDYSEVLAHLKEAKDGQIESDGAGVDTENAGNGQDNGDAWDPEVLSKVEFMPGMKEEFIDESEEHIGTIEAVLLKMEREEASSEDIDDLFRSLHSIKGNAGLLLSTIDDPEIRKRHPLAEFQALSHSLEEMVQKRRDAGQMPVPEELNRLFKGLDRLRFLLEVIDKNEMPAEMIDAMEKGQAEQTIEGRDTAGRDDNEQWRMEELPDNMDKLSSSEIEALINTLSQAMEAANKGLEELLDPSKRKTALAKVGRAFEMISKVALKMGDDKVAEEAEKSYNIVEFMSNNEEPEDHEAILIDGIREGFSLFDALLARLKERVEASSQQQLNGTEEAPVSSEKQDMTKKEQQSQAARAKTKSRQTHLKTAEVKKQVIKVPQERLDKLMNLVGELVVTKNNFAILAREVDVEYGLPQLSKKIKEFGDTVSRIVDELQATIMTVRMVPVNQVFSRFPRMVRDLSRKLGKKIKLVMSGEETEMDKTIIEALGDPMVHLIRNCADHGIESPDERKQKGKPEEGTIWLRAYNKGQSVIIEIEDDGKGIDPNRIKMKALERGLITNDDIETMSDKEAIMLIFKPGFSTAEQVSEVSGRGVGMDVVRTAIEKIGGSVDLDSSLGQGTKVTLRLPLTLAISKGLEVEVAGERFYIPLDYVVETVKAPANALHWHRGKTLVMIRGNLLQMNDLEEALGGDNFYHKTKANKVTLKLDGHADGDGQGYEDEIPLVVLNLGNKKLALKVDSFYNESEFVLKPLQGPLESLPGFAGATVTGEGDILLVLDPPKLLSMN